MFRITCRHFSTGSRIWSFEFSIFQVILCLHSYSCWWASLWWTECLAWLCRKLSADPPKRDWRERRMCDTSRDPAQVNGRALLRQLCPPSCRHRYPGIRYLLTSESSERWGWPGDGMWLTLLAGLRSNHSMEQVDAMPASHVSVFLYLTLTRMSHNHHSQSLISGFSGQDYVTRSAVRRWFLMTTLTLITSASFGDLQNNELQQLSSSLCFICICLQ